MKRNALIVDLGDNVLEKCPFCGGKGHIVKEGGQYAPCCMNGYIPEKDCPECYMAPHFPAFPTFEEAVEAWNRRAK
ncbi:hypothetical protein [Ruminococcus flavefaciens]|uniref:hypothetical protein n=1 Tax=Ruminococcus flavefaciens TaxID=1265 RepID=UPI0026ECD68B|nr:hypothetical protein [Ruminococcus flavefaciens]